jgi:hypothetical protein
VLKAAGPAQLMILMCFTISGYSLLNLCAKKNAKTLDCAAPNECPDIKSVLFYFLTSLNIALKFSE